MKGAIIGDIAGSFREFSKDKFSELPILPARGDIPFQARHNYKFTDDSVTTAATWLALQEPVVTPEIFRSSYYTYCRLFGTTNYGKGFRGWLAGPYDRAEPYNSCGNGSAMRVSPVAWFTDTPEECARVAQMSAEVTHNHPEGIKGAVFTALMVFYYRKGHPNPEQVIERDHGLSYGRSRGYDHFDMVCQETLPLALHALDGATDFESAVHKAVTIPRGDSDTLGAIVGSIAEARWGVPQKFIDQVINGFMLPPAILKILT